MKHIRHHSAAYRAVSAVVTLAVTAFVFVNRMVRGWMNDDEDDLIDWSIVGIILGFLAVGLAAVVLFDVTF